MKSDSALNNSHLPLLLSIRIWKKAIIIIAQKISVEHEGVPVHVTKAYKWSRVVAPFVLKINPSWSCTVKVTNLLLYLLKHSSTRCGGD